MPASHTDILPDRSWTFPRPTRAPHGLRPVVRLVAILDRLVPWRERASRRRVLAALDGRGPNDLGLTRAVAAREAGKPVWRP